MADLQVTEDPGRTAGKAEGELRDSPRSPSEPGKTPGQAEGDRETVEQQRPTTTEKEQPC